MIHNASVMGAVASCGLQLYSFGQTVSIPLWEESWEPDSFYEKIRVNKSVSNDALEGPTASSGDGVASSISITWLHARCVSCSPPAPPGREANRLVKR